MIPLLTLAAVFVLTAVRQVGAARLAIWQVMAGGAAVVLLTGSISVQEALRAVDADVLLFLFGMFVVGQALEQSGYLSHLTYRYFKRARSLDSLVLMVLVGTGILSAILMNDTLAVIGTPVMLLLARKHGMSAKPLLLTLAFGITIGSVISPIGNPQNLLVAVRAELHNPFVVFLRWLLLPTAVNMAAAFGLLKLMHRKDFHSAELKHSQEPIRNHDLAGLSRMSLQIILVLIAVKVVSAAAGSGSFLRLTHIALAACLPILVGSAQRWQILKRVDWHTLVFFAGMFVLMQSVWGTGFLQGLLERWSIDLRAPGAVIGISVVFSQIVSNVPLVALMLPLVSGGGQPALLALAAGSTIAGNLTILGAASNVIIIQNAERRGKETVTFMEFARIGAPLTVINAAVIWCCLTWC